MRWLIGLVVFLVPALAAAASTGASITLICPLPVVALAAVGAAMVAGGTAAAIKGAMSGYGGNYSGGNHYQADSDALRQSAQGDWSQSDQTRGQQEDYITMMQKQAAGQGPSVAQGQLRQGLDQALQQQRGQMAMASGANRSLAARTGSMNMAQMGQQMAGDSAMLRAQEMLAGRQQLGEGLLGIRGQDVGQATAQMQSTAQAAQVNQQLQQQAALEQEKLKADAENKKSDRWSQLGGALIGGGGRMLGAAGG